MDSAVSLPAQGDVDCSCLSGSGKLFSIFDGAEDFERRITDPYGWARQCGSGVGHAYRCRLGILGDRSRSFWVYRDYDGGSNGVRVYGCRSGS